MSGECLECGEPSFLCPACCCCYDCCDCLEEGEDDDDSVDEARREPRPNIR